MSQTTFDRRGTNRFEDDIALQLSPGHGQARSSLPGRARDLSESGLCAALEGPAGEPGHAIDLTLHLPYPHQSFSVRAEIRWRRASNGRHVYGVQFTDMFNNHIVLQDYMTRHVAGAKNLPDRRLASRRAHVRPVDGAGEQRRSERRQPRPVRRMQWPSSLEQFLRQEEGALPAGRRGADHAAVPEYPLMVGGQPLRTENVEYFPFVEKAILDFKGTRHVVSQLKKGALPDNYKDVIVGKYYVGRPETNARAMEASHEASLAFRHLPLAKRQKILLDIHDLLVAEKKNLINLMVAEGHPVGLAEWEFVGMQAAFHPESIRFYTEEMLKEMGTRQGDSVFVARRPDGVVCVAPPKNAPCSIPIMAAFALLPGNAMLIKPPLRCPLSCTYLWQNIIHVAARANGAPPGVINTVIGHSETIMREWLESPLTNDIFFFGDSKMGLEIGVEAYRHGKKPILELSGNDFMVVWDDAPLDRAVDALVDGLRGSMQICMAPKKALVHPAVFDAFVERVVKAVQDRARVGLPSDPRTYLTPVTRIRECQVALHTALADGAHLLSGGRRLNHLGEPDANGAFFEATVVSIRDDDPLRYSCVAEENFFPLLPLIRMKGESSSPSDDVFNWTVNLLNRNNYALRTSVWTRSKRWASRFAEAVVNCGLLRINSPHVGFSTFLSPNGGGRRSGGPFGEMNYPWLKTSRLQGISIHWPEGSPR